MDEMQEYELQTIVDNLKYVDRTSWEQTRLSIYSNAQMNTKKQLKVTDIIKFAWDDVKDSHDTEMSTADLNRLREMAKKIQITE